MSDLRTLTVRDSSAWDAQKIERYLLTSVLPVRMGCVDGSGVPLVVSLWYVWDQQRIWCALHRSAAVLRYLRGAGCCGFEIAGDGPPYCGVRGQGKVAIHKQHGAHVLDALLRRYGIAADSRLSVWLRSRQADEYAVAIEPQWLTAWDYTERMRDALVP
jgi:hypothetical protein